MKFRSNVFVASSNRLSPCAPGGSSCAKWNSSGRSSSEMYSLSLTATRPLDQVLELADVARPPVLLQHRHRRVGDALDLLAEARVVAAQKELGELRDVLGASRSGGSLIGMTLIR